MGIPKIIFGRPFPGRLSHGHPAVLVVVKGSQSPPHLLGDALGFRGADLDAPRRLDMRARTARVQADHRKSRGHGLDDDRSPAVPEAREQEDIGRPHSFQDLVARKPILDLHGMGEPKLVDEPLQPRFLRPLADDEHPCVRMFGREPAEGTDGDGESLEPVEPARRQDLEGSIVPGRDRTLPDVIPGNAVDREKNDLIPPAPRDEFAGFVVADEESPRLPDRAATDGIPPSEPLGDVPSVLGKPAVKRIFRPERPWGPLPPTHGPPDERHGKKGPNIAGDPIVAERHVMGDIELDLLMQPPGDPPGLDLPEVIIDPLSELDLVKPFELRPAVPRKRNRGDPFAPVGRALSTPGLL